MNEASRQDMWGKKMINNLFHLERITINKEAVKRYEEPFDI
jgi:hypothetical protein